MTRNISHRLKGRDHDYQILPPNRQTFTDLVIITGWCAAVGMAPASLAGPYWVTPVSLYAVCGAHDSGLYIRWCRSEVREKDETCILYERLRDLLKLLKIKDGGRLLEQEG